MTIRKYLTGWEINTEYPDSIVIETYITNRIVITLFGMELSGASEVRKHSRI